MIEPEPSADQIEAGIDMLGGPLEPVLDLLRGLVVQELEFGLPVSAVFTERSSQSRLKW